MKALGYTLIVAGFLAGSYFTVVQVEEVPVVSFLVVLGVGVLGVVLVRTALRREANQEDTLTANLGVLDTTLATIVSLVDDLDDRKNDIDVYDLRLEIDRLLPEHLATFVDARKSIAHRFGLQAYADVMNPFSAGERYINRVWSASTDGYIDEAHTYLDKAREQFDEAGKVLARVRQTA